MGESWGDLVAGEYMFSHGYSTGANPWAVGPYATGNKARRHPRLRDQPEPAELLRLRLRHHRRRGARRRRDLERHPVGGPPGAREASGTRRSPTPTRRSSCGCAQGTRDRAPLPAEPVPGQPPLGPADVRRVPAPAGRDDHARRPRRDARRRPDALRRREPEGHVGRVRPPRHGQGRQHAQRRLGRRDAELRLARRSRQRPGRPWPPRAGRLYVGRYEARATPVADTLGGTKLDAVVSLVPGRYQMLYVSASRGFQRFTLTVTAGPAHGPLRVARPEEPGRQAATAPRWSAPATGSLNADALIDGTEATNWAGVNDGTNVDATGSTRSSWSTSPAACRPCAGSRSARCCARRRPSPTDMPLAADPDSGSRFTALRRFALEACTSGCDSADAHVEAVLHLAGRRLPGRPAAAGGAEPDPAWPSTCGTRARRRSGSWPWRTSAPASPATPASRTTTRPTTPTARRRPTAGGRCAPRSCRCTDPALHPHRGDGQAPGPCPPPSVRLHRPRLAPCDP